MAPDLEELEAWWHDRPVEGVLPGCLPWLPYSLTQFRVLLAEAVQAARGRTFLDAGCGIGTKCLEAGNRGLLAAGMDIVLVYLAQAALLNVACFCADARTWNGYSSWDIVYLNHPLADDSEEALLERYVQDQMRPGQVLMTVNSMAPPVSGWRLIASLEVHDLVAVKCDGDHDGIGIGIGGTAGGH